MIGCIPNWFWILSEKPKLLLALNFWGQGRNFISARFQLVTSNNWGHYECVSEDLLTAPWRAFISFSFHSIGLGLNLKLSVALLQISRKISLWKKRDCDKHYTDTYGNINASLGTCNDFKQSLQDSVVVHRSYKIGTCFTEILLIMVSSDEDLRYDYLTVQCMRNSDNRLYPVPLNPTQSGGIPSVRGCTTLEWEVVLVRVWGHNQLTQGFWRGRWRKISIW